MLGFCCYFAHLTSVIVLASPFSAHSTTLPIRLARFLAPSSLWLQTVSLPTAVTRIRRVPPLFSEPPINDSPTRLSAGAASPRDAQVGMASEYTRNNESRE